MLIPLAIWTVAGLIALWPGNISAHINPDVAGYSVAGVTYPKARITAISEISCDGLAGVDAGSEHPVRQCHGRRCSRATTRARPSTVPLTAAVYSSGVEVGQVVRLVRVPPADGQPAQYQFSDFERRRRR